ncbi:GNAT family N-acetyltransferase [Vibrio sp. WXL210]|uniref:GNAT family N-acetyltransferase n=1 Tax=Vibrio sp. WXL210 TaxID=3450709 RepID=UPI003EC7C2C9
MKTIQAKVGDIDSVAFLFDLYRQFYHQSANLSAARGFIFERLTADDSVIFLALDDNDVAVGFCQLYPSFSSVAMQPLFYLNDLYVVEEKRGQGVARKLLQHAESYARECQATTLKLATAVENHSAKCLYLSVGYKEITDFEHYRLDLTGE